MESQRPQTEVLPVIALRNMVMFPGIVTTLRVGRPRSVKALEKAAAGDGRVIMVSQREGETERPAAEDLYGFGVICTVQSLGESEDGLRTPAILGQQRCRIREFRQMDSFILAEAETLQDRGEEVPEDLRQRLRNLFESTEQGAVMVSMMRVMESPPPLEYAIAYVLDLSVEDKQRLLAEQRPADRYRMLLPVLEIELQIEQVGARLRRESERALGAAEREEFLRDRKEQILGQLSDLAGQRGDISALAERIREADLPPEARQEAERELARLESMPAESPEHALVRDWLEWMADMPWNVSTAGQVDLAEAERILDRDHYDRTDVKERILEYLSVRKLRPQSEGAILCFVGAPGTGKTSMGRSIAAATGRRFHRVSLGGVRDEAELRGHRRTYIGALPGRIVRALRTVGANNPVLMLDEVDKLQAGLRGDPTSALLEVLDPEQNNAFVDNYLGVPVDMSRVMFIGTANTTDTIPPTLLDRMEVIELPGYTTREKVIIAQRYLLDKQLRSAGLRGKVELTQGAVERLVEEYTHEAGVRNLERQIGAICRKLVRRQLGGETFFQCIDREAVVDLLGPPKFSPRRLEKEHKPGICPTLTISAAGGDLLLVEMLRAAGSGQLIVTGRAGEVLEESVRLAFTFWKARAAHYGFAAEEFSRNDFHVHFPAAAQPKEGTSAGLPAALAFASLLSDRPLPDGVAALGEITLRGRLLRVERLPERLAAAGRSGINHLILPERNRAHVEGMEDRDCLEDLKVEYADTVDEALRAVLPSIVPAGSSATAG